MRESVLLLLFFVAGLISEILGTVGGFGSSVLFVPMANFFMDFQSVLGITTFFHLFSNVSKMVLFRKYFNIEVLLWIGIPGIILVAVGALLSSIWGNAFLQLLLGIFLCLFAVFFMLNPLWKIKNTKSNLVFFGGTAGFLAGLLGTGGAIRGVALTSLGLTKEVFVGTSAAIDFGVDLTRGIIYTNKGFLHWHDWKYMLVLIIVAILGSYIGKILLQKISQQTFEKVVLILVMVSGVSLIVKYFQTLG